MKPETILRKLLSDYWSIEAENITCVPFGKGASGRFLGRLSDHGRSLVGVYWTLAREDNDAFIPAALFLESKGVSVPHVELYRELADAKGNSEGGMALIEDLGDEDLLSLKDHHWEEKKTFYIQALKELKKLHDASGYTHCQSPFDEKLYLWEQSYFTEHCLETHLGWTDGRELMECSQLKELAAGLSEQPRCLIHRDFQSQNIMIRGEAVALIDFQGMRKGLGEYDLASLLYDPYAGLTRDEREELMDEWERICGSPLNKDIFYKCACQRLMQVLGAFANIGHNAGIDWYLDHIPSAIDSLCEVLSITKRAKPLETRLLKFNKVLV